MIRPDLPVDEAAQAAALDVAAAPVSPDQARRIAFRDRRCRRQGGSPTGVRSLVRESG